MAPKVKRPASRMMASEEVKYSMIGSSDYLLEKDTRRKASGSNALHITLFLCTAPIFFTLGFLVSHLRRSTEYVTWTPDLPRLQRTPVKFDGSFEFANKFRGTPSPELDYEWDRFTTHPFSDGTASMISVTLDDVRRANKTAEVDWLNSTVVYEGGGYMASLELFHQLHCLVGYLQAGFVANEKNMLRKAIHTEYYEEMRPLANGSYSHKAITHLDHCVEIIRQVISCQSDTGLITYHWVENNPVAYPDFNTWHQCRDPEEVLAWSKAREVDIQSRPTKRPGDIEMPLAP